MSRLLPLLIAALALTACGPSQNASDFNSGLDNGGTFGRPSGIDAMAALIRSGNIPPEAILATVYFGFDRYAVEAGERAKLDAIAGRVGATTVLLAGYTDHVGTEEYNLGLSDRRAQSVADYLVRLGGSRARMEVIALGEQQAAQGATGAAAALDRKVHIVDANYRGGAASRSTETARPINAAPGAAPEPVGLN
jgi:outer membrane protein OmpA-like peptidoglycan-associated protein